MHWKTVGSYDDYISDSPIPIKPQHVVVVVAEVPQDFDPEVREHISAVKDNLVPEFEFRVPAGCQMEKVSKDMVRPNAPNLISGVFGFTENGTRCIYVADTDEGRRYLIVFESEFI